MKKHVLVIHGGDIFGTYQEYLASLKKEKVSLEEPKWTGWKDTLGRTLGKNFQVIFPEMPHRDNAKYIEWKIWFEKYIPFLKPNIVLVGHSLGGIFLAKYLSENKFPKKIRATFLVAAPHLDKLGKYNAVESVSKEWLLPKSLERLEKQGGKVFLYQSKDDQVVPFSDVKKYQKTLPSAHTRIFSNKGHFRLEKFPEILKDIKDIVSKNPKKST